MKFPNFTFEGGRRQTGRQVVNRLLKVVKRHLQRQNSTLICFKYIFLGTLLSNFQKFWGGGGGLKPPLPLPPLRLCHGLNNKTRFRQERENPLYNVARNFDDSFSIIGL